MSTSVTYTQFFAAEPTTVWEMLAHEEYVHHKGMRSGSMEVSAEVDDRGHEIVIISRRTLPAKVPGFMKRFVGEEIVLNETQVWGAATANGSRDGEFVIDFGGQPMAFSGRLSLRPSEGGTEVTTMGQVKASIPLVGGKAEAIAKEWTIKYLKTEEQVAGEWLVENGTD